MRCLYHRCTLSPEERKTGLHLTLKCELVPLWHVSMHKGAQQQNVEVLVWRLAGAGPLRRPPAILWTSRAGH